MTRFPKTPTVSALALTGLTLTLAHGIPVQAQRTSGQGAQTATETATPVRQFSATTGALVLEALTLMNDGQNEQALVKLGQALSLPTLNQYETSIIYQMQGSAHYEQDRFAASITAFENAISAGGLSPKEVNQMDPIIAQLMIANGQLAEGCERLDKHTKRNEVDQVKYQELMSTLGLRYQSPCGHE